MSVITDLDETWEEKTQREDTFAARAALESCTMTVDETLRRIQEIVDSGHFGTIPPDLKAALIRWWNIYKDAKASFVADSELIDIYQCD